MVSDSLISKYQIINRYKQLIGEALNKNNYLEILSLTELLKKLLTETYQGSDNQFVRSKQINFHLFKEKFSTQYNLEEIDSKHLWQEIYYLLKGNATYSINEKGLIALEDYQQQIQNYSFLPLNVNHQKIYKLAEKYQQWLKENNYWDDNDLSRYLLTHLHEDNIGKYYIYGDNIHHWSEISLKLICQLTTAEKTFALT
ncbi:MAG: hypothetical protein Kow0091_20380 [Geminocystis sp.]